MFNIGILKELDLSELGIDETVISGILALLVGYIAVLGVVSLVMYLLRAIGIYQMAKNSGISTPWVSFIPVANSFLFGKLAEKYRKKDGSPSAKFSILLLVFNILTLISGIMLLVFSLLSTVAILRFANTAVQSGTEMTIDMFSSLIPVIIFYVILMGVALSYMILHYVALWRIFSSFDYKNATLYTVLSVFFSFLDPIFLFILRNKPPVFDPREHFNNFQ